MKKLHMVTQYTPFDGNRDDVELMFFRSPQSGAPAHIIHKPEPFKRLSRLHHGHVDLDRTFDAEITVQLPRESWQLLEDGKIEHLHFWDWHSHVDRGEDGKKEASASAITARFMSNPTRLEVRFHGADEPLAKQLSLRVHVMLGDAAVKNLHDPDKFGDAGGKYAHQLLDREFLKPHQFACHWQVQSGKRLCRFICQWGAGSFAGCKLVHVPPLQT